MWRLAHNSTAFCVNLQRKGLKISPLCPVCRIHEEDRGHLLCKCKQVKEVWRLYGLEAERLLLMDQRTAMTMVEKLMALPVEKQALIATPMWNWRCERNNRRERGRGKLSEELAWIIQHQTREFCTLQQNQKNAWSLPKQRWTPPPEEWIKINIDGSFRPDERNGGWGAVFRDHVGDVLVCASRFLPNILNALHSEMLAAEIALHLASDLGMGRVYLETDALLL
ncbi:uncharacterized protein [Aegilops tauschii subsp. strangulata]|uniref:uncharacterized protein n=1 Tax=Aegilops tauschii subsp. strangulata TaxID=200361 RepID=UPI003CC88844